MNTSDRKEIISEIRRLMGICMGKEIKGNIVIDLGAHIGVFSVYAALYGAEKVYAYEPLKENYDLLVKNIAVNNLQDKIIPIQKAVTDKKGKTPDPKTSQDEVDKIAASNAEKNLESSEYANDPLQEISKELKQRYHDKATSTINNV